MRLLTYLAMMTWALGANANVGEWVSQPHSSARLLADHRETPAGQEVTAGLHLKLDPGWHVYWKNPGDSGMPTSLSWSLPEGFTAGPLQWPAPHRIDSGPVTSYGYDDTVLLMSTLTLPRSLAGGTATLNAQADWLVCKEICIPASAKLTLALSAGSRPTPRDKVVSLFNDTRRNLPQPLSGWLAQAIQRGTEVSVTLSPADGTGVGLTKLSFIPDREGDIEDSFEQVFERAGTSYKLVLKGTDVVLASLTGLLVAEPHFGTARSASIDIPVSASTAAPASSTDMTFVAAAALAFAGGLILNLMPCVFPVLAIKILGVMARAHGQSWKLKEHAVLFTGGVLVSFLAIAAVLLALRAQGAALGWGFQLQSPAVVTALALLFFVLGLNLSGVFHLGGRAQSLAGGLRLRNERLDAVASGLIATLVATPCTAPFMGAALGYAITQPAPRALAVFAAIALGMALPYGLLCFFPGILKRLPRPGPWMETLKQFLAFPLYATVVWLVWVLGRQIGMDGAAKLLLALVVLACAMWIQGRPGIRGWLRTMIGTALLFLAGAIAWPWSTDPARAPGNEWLPWSEIAVHSALSAGQPVFVDFTAAWCVSCQVNKQFVLHREAVARGFAQFEVLHLRADWTKKDPAITLALEKLGRNGVPVYALYTPGQGEPKLLPEILTQGIVLDALSQLPVKVRKVNKLTPTNE
ncbi:MAG: hypothetical protein EXR36_10405 [Betaproteobacteria bacterium]|nr:hypothetical protein [Betaproteobacteria bacterium]